jgi:hypothetical protein
VNGDILKFVDAPVSLTVKDKNDEAKTVLVPARQHPMAPGLAVTMLNFGVFCVTHLPTGTAMDRGSEREGSASLRLACFASIAKDNGFSWDQINTGAEAGERLAAIKDNPVPFDGATSTSSEGTRPLTVGEWFMHLKTSWVSDEFPWETASEHPLEQAVIQLEKLREA